MFRSELYIFPLPTHIFTKDGKTGNARFHQAEQTLCFSDHVLSPPLSSKINKRGMLAKLCVEVDETDWQKSSVQQGKPDPKDLWRPKDNQHKAQISSTSFTISTKLLYSGVVSIE